MATTSMLIILPDSSWKKSYEFQRLNRVLKITWAGRGSSGLPSAHGFPSEGEILAFRRNFGVSASARTLRAASARYPAHSPAWLPHLARMPRASLPHCSAPFRASCPHSRMYAARSSASLSPCVRSPALPRTLACVSHHSPACDARTSPQRCCLATRLRVAPASACACLAPACGIRVRIHAMPARISRDHPCRSRIASSHFSRIRTLLVHGRLGAAAWMTKGFGWLRMDMHGLILARFCMD